MNSYDLEKRHESEKEFHDLKLTVNKKESYYDIGFTDIIFKEMLKKLGDINQKNVLEFGCGDGWLTRLLASKGANIWSFDISNEAVNQNKAMIKQMKLEHRVQIDQMAAEELKYDSDMFDIILGNAILHHLEIEKSLKEMRRVLKKGGRAIFLEPLGHNPLINLFRKCTPNMRSKDETPFRFEDFITIRKYFPKFQHDEYYLFVVFALSFYFIGAKSLSLKSRDLLARFDQFIISCIPFLRRYCWYSIFELEKQ